LPESWKQALLRMLGNVADPALLPGERTKALKGVRSLFVICSVVCDSDDPEVLRVESACRRVLIKRLLEAGFDLAVDESSFVLWTVIEVVRDPRRDVCVVGLRGRLTRTVQFTSPDQTSRFQLVWRAMPLFGATRKSRLAKDVERLLRAHVEDFITDCAADVHR